MSNAEPLIECISLPTPYPVGRINTYLVHGERPILIDTGVKSDRSLTELEEALRTRELDFDDIEAILITHRHYDHAGAAGELARRTGAKVVCHRGSILDEEKGRRTFLDLIARYGAPEETLTILEQTWTMGDSLGEPLSSIDGIELIDDDEELEIGGLRFTPKFTPGHSPGHLCFRVEGSAALVCGDLLLAHITSNPLPHFNAEAPRGRNPSLELYLDSLEKIATLGPLEGYPGHGKQLPDTALAAKEAQEHIRKRSQKLHRMMHRWNGRQIFEIARKFFWEESVLGQALAFCEILAHADYLEDQGLINVEPDKGVIQILSS